MGSIAAIGSNRRMDNPHRAARGAVGRSYRGLSPEDRAAARRRRLVEAGTALIGRQGLRATTVRGVCREAGLTDRYFYESFGSLEDLLQAVYRRLMDELGAAMRRGAPPRGTSAEPEADDALLERSFRHGYRVWFDFVSEPAHARIVLAEVLGVSPGVDQLYADGMQAFATMTARLLAAADGGDAEGHGLVAHALVGAAVQLARQWALGGHAEARDEVVETCVVVAMGTVRALRSAAPPTPQAPGVSAPARRASRR